MPVTDITTDITARTITITAHFDAPVERVWQIYADPRQLEQVWGPPEFPATFDQHDLRPGGRSTYVMTGADGERFGGWWEVTAVDEPHGFDYRDGFADGDGNPLEAMPVSENSLRLTPDGTGTKLVATSVFASEDGIRQVVEMGIEEGTRDAMNQIDGLLASS